MLISLIVAMAKNRTIGCQGKLPWHLPEDLQHFKRETMGHTLLMGRKTYQSIGRPLPGRSSFIVSRNPQFVAPDCQVFGVLAAALAAAEAAGETELFICGGEELYRQTLPLCHRIYLTELAEEVAGDRYFPVIPTGQFRQVRQPAGADGQGYRFSLLERLP